MLNIILLSAKVIDVMSAIASPATSPAANGNATSVTPNPTAKPAPTCSTQTTTKKPKIQTTISLLFLLG